jgi:hypothetical protein
MNASIPPEQVNPPAGTEDADPPVHVPADAVAEPAGQHVLAGGTADDDE